jgi:hypothetical protein
MAGNDDLHPLLRSINQTMSALREDVQRLTGEVKKIPEVLERGFSQLRDAIHENIQAQAELKLMEHMMEVSAVKPQIEAEREQLETVQNELEQRMESISERYEGKQAELDEKAEKRVRELGSHIFTIEEEEFEAGIEEPFTTQVTPVWRNLQAHNTLVNQDRRTELVGTAESVSKEIDSFLRRKERLLTQIDDHLLDPQAVPIETTSQTEIQLPYYAVDYEVDGVAERAIVAPSELLAAQDPNTWSSVTLESFQGADELIDPNRSMNHSEVTTQKLDRRGVLGVLDEYGTESRLGPSYTDAAAESLPEGVTVTVEGGAN